MIFIDFEITRIYFRISMMFVISDKFSNIFLIISADVHLLILNRHNLCLQWFYWNFTMQLWRTCFLHVSATPKLGKLWNQFLFLFTSLRFEKIDYTVADFDRILYRIHNPDKDKSKLLVSLLVNFFDELKEYDVEGVSFSTLITKDFYISNQMMRKFCNIFLASSKGIWSLYVRTAPPRLFSHPLLWFTKCSWQLREYRPACCNAETELLRCSFWAFFPSSGLSGWTNHL